MSDDREEGAEPQDNETSSRRRFLKLVAGTLAGAYAVGEVAAEDRPTIRPQRPPVRIQPIKIQPPTVAQGIRPQGGDEMPLPPWKDDRQDPDRPPKYGPLIVMERPRYDPTPPGEVPWLYANRFLWRWEDDFTDPPSVAQQVAMLRAPDWSTRVEGDAYYDYMYELGHPHWAVSTIWNKGRAPAYGVMMRAICLAVARVSGTRWQEVHRVDLGYLSVGALSPGDYVEVRYPAVTVRDGMRALDDWLMLNDPTCAQYPHVWYYHECFAFDPIRDPFSAKPPLEALDPPRGILVGRHVAGWRWEASPQAQYSARARTFT